MTEQKPDNHSHDFASIGNETSGDGVTYVVERCAVCGLERFRPIRDRAWAREQLRAGQRMGFMDDEEQQR